MKSTGNLRDLGQSLWLDNTTRNLLQGGLLRRYIDGSYSGGTETRTSEIWYWDAVGWILCINA
ncbi:MAG TPA: hypothetical protein VE860_00270 [Chthoniobacterales bacterium]|nr:hypothetical protein [Chthoniobacterales bacterium]